MSSKYPNVHLLGSEKVASLPGLFESFGLPPNFEEDLITHLHDVLRKQHPTISIEEIEFLNEPLCNLGGMQLEDEKHLIKAQTMTFPLQLRVTMGTPTGVRHEITLELVIKCENLDSAPTMSTDMFVKAQRALS